MLRLHWSIPISAGYGRRLRFVIYDEANGKLIGLFGLGDPVFGLGPRDRLDRLGPPNASSPFAVRHEPVRARRGTALFEPAPRQARRSSCHELGKYKLLSPGRTAAELGRSAEKPLDTRLALLTTTSAFGRSSLYNRLRYRDRQAFHSVGFTSGHRRFSFQRRLLFRSARIRVPVLHPDGQATALGSWFSRNRRELVRKALPLLGLSCDLLRHGIQRQILVAPLAANARKFLCGDDNELTDYCSTTAEIFAWFRERWLLPRAARDARYRDFDPETFRLWGAE